MSASDGATILYEYPFNERVRTMLRLEDLFEKLAYFCRQTHPYCHHAALLTLFEILEVTSRADLKNDLMQELERYRQSLSALRSNPQVEPGALSAVLDEIDAALSNLAASTGKAGHHLRENEWLMSIRSRAIIPGGTCEFDLPSYHAWLSRPGETRAADLDAWSRPLSLFAQGVAIVLKLLRESAHRSAQNAVMGSFQQTLQGRTCALLQVRLLQASEAIPEISANKYMLWIRFTFQGRDLRPRPVERDVPFELALCAF
ncbi:MAG TPA: cell division protein ZapD [Burkholderiaceae bacterium]|nr:cell division protein ZapD [Burkholderiaceae bacterium]